MIEGQNAEISVEWAKCFLFQKDTAETLLSYEKLRAIFKNFAAIYEVPSYLLLIKSIKKEDLESTIKNYYPKHHNNCTANYGSYMFARVQNKRWKIQENDKDNDSLTSPPTATRRRSNDSVMRELVCCFCHEIDVETKLCAARAYHAKRSKNDVKHVSNLTKKLIDMDKVINDNVLLRKLSDGDVTAKELYYNKHEIKGCLQSFKRQYNQALRKSQRSTHDCNDDKYWIKVNALNTAYSFMFEEKCQGVEMFYAKDLEKIYLEIL